MERKGNYRSIDNDGTFQQGDPLKRQKSLDTFHRRDLEQRFHESHRLIPNIKENIGKFRRIDGALEKAEISVDEYDSLVKQANEAIAHYKNPIGGKISAVRYLEQAMKRLIELNERWMHHQQDIIQDIFPEEKEQFEKLDESFQLSIKKYKQFIDERKKALDDERAL